MEFFDEAKRGVGVGAEEDAEMKQWRPLVRRMAARLDREREEQDPKW
jgi:hypothetical protein